MRIRVFAGIGVAAALLGLTGCRSSPAVAAYVGDRTVTETEVTNLISNHQEWAQAQANARAQAEQTEPERVEPLQRTFVVNNLVRGELCDQARVKMNLPEPELNIPQGVNPSDFGLLYTKRQACENALPAGEPVKPTEAEAREIFATGVAAGVIDPKSAGTTIPALIDEPGVAEALGRKKAFNDAIAGIGVTVNPKYGVVEVPLASFAGGIPAVSVKFGEPGPVSNQPIQPSAPPQPQ